MSFLEQLIGILENQFPKSLKKRIYKRKFLHYLALTLASPLLIELTQSCSTISKPSYENDNNKKPIYKRDPNSIKYQPPEQGCDIGFLSGYGSSPQTPIGWKQKLGKGPKIMVIDPIAWFFGNTEFQYSKSSAQRFAKQGTTAWVYRNFTSDIKKHGFSNLPNNKEHRKELERYADEIIDAGVPIIYCPMWEMNMTYPVWKWNSQPNAFKKAWIHNWEVFEDKGANELVTWAQEYQLEYPIGESYHPGDKYVDLIAGSSHHKIGSRFTFSEYKRIIKKGHDYFTKHHGNIPFGMIEMSTYKSPGQAKRYQSLFNHIKKLKGIKFAITWNFQSPFGKGSNNYLNEECFKMLAAIFLDDYWKGI